VTARCPICRKPTDPEKNSDFPFCSERCRLLDLGNWASEKHRISQPVFDESEFENIERNPHDSDSSRQPHDPDDPHRGRNGEDEVQ
jgi:endogenous inhibitor of DNA gyrase (YacG/DUF329 family)